MTPERRNPTLHEILQRRRGTATNWSTPPLAADEWQVTLDEDAGGLDAAMLALDGVSDTVLADNADLFDAQTQRLLTQAADRQAFDEAKAELAALLGEFDYAVASACEDPTRPFRIRFDPAQVELLAAFGLTDAYGAHLSKH